MEHSVGFSIPEGSSDEAADESSSEECEHTKSETKVLELHRKSCKTTATERGIMRKFFSTLPDPCEANRRHPSSNAAQQQFVEF